MMQRLIYKLTINQKLTIPIIVLIITAGIYSVYGFEGELSRDNANHLYSGQMMADGIPPYVGFFNHTGPLAPMLTGLVVMVSDNFQWDDIYTVRLVFFLIGCFTVLSVYLLANNLFNSNRVGIFSALVFLGFSDFAKEAANGPQKKTPMVLFATMSLLLTSKKRWFWAGLFGSLASLTWQPAVIFPIVTLILAFISARKRVVNAVINTCAGILLPSAAMFAYFQYHGAVKEFLEGYILFNFYYLDRGEYPLISHLLRPLYVVLTRYTYMSVTIIIGFFMILYIYIWRFSLNNTYKKLLNNDHFAPVLISFPLIILLSLFDFQSAPDFYIFLPYVAMGFAFFIEQAIGFMEKTNSTLVTKMPTHIFTLATFLILIGMASANAYLNREGGLYRQKRTAIVLEEKFGKNYKLISIGVPQLLVLLQKRNPVPYAFIDSGIDQLIQARTPGGFEGWLEELEIFDPDVIAYGPSRGVHLIKLENWLESRYQLTQIGPWRLYVKEIHTRFYYKDFERVLIAKASQNL